VNKFESLHNHTSRTDGKQTHLEVLAAAEKLGYGVIAFTDHDWVPDDGVLAELRAYTGPIKWLIGVELSAAHPDETGAEHGIHMLGLFTDPKNAALQEHLQKLSVSRIKRMEFYVQHLTSIGFDVTVADCIQAAIGSESVGSPHIVKAVLSKPANVELMEKMRLEMEVASKADTEVKAKYDQMMSDGPRQYPYGLFMKKHSFKPVPLERQDFGGMISVGESAKLIREAGGIALMAHWFFYDSMSKSDLEQYITKGELDGVELEVVNLITKRDLTTDRSYLEVLVTEHNLIGTVGSDGHDEADMKAFAESSAAESSIGQTAAIIAKIKPDLTWTNF
jgi:predicted metal-dependent phosphoesterase TrpH